MKTLGIDIGGTEIKVALVDEFGNVSRHTSFPTEARNGGEALMHKVLDIISKYDGFDKVGISTAGQIDPVNGIVVYATDNIPGWTGMRIKERVETRYGLPTAVENDVNCSALGEAHYGAGRGSDSFLCLTYGTGIGGAIIEDKKIYRGSKCSAGEFGHMITHYNGRDCTCGGKGCYEAYASTTALCSMAALALGMDKINGRELFKLIDGGNRVGIEVLDGWVEEIVCGLVSLTHIFNPSKIVLGGGIMEQQIIIQKIASKLYSSIMTSYKNVSVESAELGNMAGILGAVYLANSI